MFFVCLAADAVDEGGLSRDRPIPEEGLVERYLPECKFRGRDNHKIRYAVLAVAAVHGGVELDLLEEVAYSATDDFRSYAGLAAVAWARAVADQRGVALREPVPSLLRPGPALASTPTSSGTRCLCPLCAASHSSPALTGMWATSPARPLTGLGKLLLWRR